MNKSKIKASELIKSSCCATLLDVPKSELVAMVERLEKIEESISTIIDNSEGVGGYHLNGELAFWGEFELSELLKNG